MWLSIPYTWLSIAAGAVDDGAVPASRPAFELPLLLAAAFRSIVDDLHAELAEQGHPGVRPVHGFALQAIGPDGASTSELGRRLGVSKQAAAKTASALVAMGYVESTADEHDARSRTLRRTERGDDCLDRSAAIFERLRHGWADQLGAKRVSQLEDDLATVVGTRGATTLGDLPGWLR